MSMSEEYGRVTPLPPRSAGPQQPLATGGGGPHDPDMEIRVSRLEEAFLRIEPLLQSLDARIGRIETRMDQSEARLDRIETRMDRIETRLDKFDARMDKFDGRLDTMDGHIRRIELDVAEVKGRITNMPSTWAMMTAIMGSQVAFAAALATMLRLSGFH